MKCDEVKVGGTTMIVCSRGRRHNCQFCPRRATKQCDFPIFRNGKKGTCDAWMCDRCAQTQHKAGCAFVLGDDHGVIVERNCTCTSDLDYCPPHERNKLKIMEARLSGNITEEAD